MNVSDSERIAAVLEEIEYKKTLRIENADLIVVNMCSVRQSAVDRIFGISQKIAKFNPEPKTILTGCILKKDRRKFSEFFDYIVDIKDINKLPEILGRKKNIEVENYLKIVPKCFNKFSANVPIMTGCNNFCAYCVVPYLRGPEVSRPAKDIIEEIEYLVKKGAREIWLLGQNVNSYKSGNIDFPKLLKMVNALPGYFWIRFTSSHPKDFSSEVISAMKNCEKVAKYLNLPIQAGDNAVLKKMNRIYTINQYKSIIKKIRKEIPNISISTDIIVGFPGETKKQFEGSAKLFEELKYDMAYINKYSPRAGTAAAKLKDNVSPKEKKRREKVLTEILKKTALAHNKKLIGKKVRVLINGRRGRTDIWFGKTEGNKTMQVESNRNLLGKFVKTEITKASSWGLTGNLT